MIPPVPGGLRFLTPAAFALLLALPLWWWWSRRRRPAAIAFSRVDLLRQGGRAGRLVPRLLVTLRALAVVAAVVALARPVSGARAERVVREGIDIMLALDLSSSMLAEDFQPQNRLQVAKDQLKAFIRGRRNDRIGLVAFAGEALTQVPLTLDYPVLLAAVDHLAAGQLEDGTAIGTAIVTAANRLRASRGRSRVLVVLTDGENNRGAIDPRTAAQAAAAFGIRVHTIGVGSEGVAPVPVGRGVFGLRYENRPVRIDESLLEDVARLGGGRYFRARDANALARVYQQIDQLERAPVGAPRYARVTEEYRWPLAVAMALVALELALLAWRGPVP